MVVEICVG